MSRFAFTGDLDFVSPRQLEFISEILEKRGFRGPEAKIENVGAAGENYMSTVKRITITENDETFKMIAKLASDNETLRAMAQTAMIFKNEHVIYSELLPKFIQIQKSAGVDTYRYPELYGVLCEEPNEIILLEDLRESQFSILDRFKELSNDCVKMVLKSLAVYHSLSYVLQRREPQLYNEIKSKFGDMYKGPAWKMDSMQKYFETMEESTKSILSNDYKNYVTGVCTNFMTLYTKTTKRDANDKHSVIQQGDGWINNIMFRIKDDVPEECILIDYQMAKESNPVFDVMYMIFNSTSHEQRHEHYYDYLDHYHRELDNSLHNYGFKASLVYPRDQMDCDLKRYGKFLFPVCLFVTNAILKNTEEAEKLKSVLNTGAQGEEFLDENAAVMFDISPETAKLFRRKVEGLIDSFLEFGYMSKTF